MGVTSYDSKRAVAILYSSKRSLKCVLLYYRNIYGAIPIDHSVHLEEEYGHIKLDLNLQKCNEHKWVICVDLKIVNFLLGQGGGLYKIFVLPPLMRYSRARDEH